MASASPTTRPPSWTPWARSPTSWPCTSRRAPAKWPPPRVRAPGTTNTLDTLRSLLDELPEDLAAQAFTHASWVDRRTESYERLARLAPAIVDAFAEQIEDALENPEDYKSLLQEALARRSEVVAYRIVEARGPAHDRSFVAVAEVSGEEIGRGRGKTKKAAEQDAASHALEHVEEDWPPEPGAAG